VERRLVVAISPLWSVRCMSEGLEHMRRALDEGADAPLAVRLDGMRQAVMWADKQGKVELARTLSDELLVLCGDDEVELARAFNTLGVLALTERRFDEARHYLEQARAKAPTVITRLAATHNLGCVALNEGDFERAVTDLERSLELAREANDEFQIHNARCDLGFALLGLGRHAEAREPLLLALREAIRLHWYEHVAYCLVGAAALAAHDGAAERAARLLGRGCGLIDELQLVFEDYAVAVRTQAERDLTEALGADAYAAAFSSGG